MNNRDSVILVNTNNEEIGLMDKLEVHQKGLLHRAFSVFIFNDQGQLLLQQRAAHKYHGANLWTNTCCSHQQWKETTIDAAHDRLNYEMGLSCHLEEIFSFIYHAEVENNLIEHELDFILVGITNSNPTINVAEVQAYKWIDIPSLKEWIAREPKVFTYWFKEALPLVLDSLSKT